MAKAYSILGMIYIDRKELDTAEKYLLKAIGYKKKRGAMYHNLGTVYLLKYKQYKDMTFLRDAYSMYKQASEIDPKFIDSKYGLAYVCELLNRKEEALKYYEEVLDIDSRSPLFLKAYKSISRIKSSMKNELP
jgi:tetratricopeptide (TPR) repeat protein